MFNLFDKSLDVKGVIGEAKSMGDTLFTSDEERQNWHYKMEKLAAKSDNVIARTGRGAIMWMLANVGVYNWIIRDLIAVLLNKELPPAAIDTEVLLKGIFSLLGGVL